MNSIGFDLDMTLVDSSEAIVQTTLSVLRGFQVTIDQEEVFESVGLPIKESFKQWVGPEYLTAYQKYVTEYQSTGYQLSIPLPGALPLLKRLTEDGVRVVVITAKNSKSAEIQLKHLDIPFDLIVGEVFRDGKTQAMMATQCIEYVGDHFEDFLAAKAAKIPFIGVSSNPTQNLILASKGKFPVMNSLNEFFQYSSLFKTV